MYTTDTSNTWHTVHVDELKQSGSFPPAKFKSTSEVSIFIAALLSESGSTLQHMLLSIGYGKHR